MVTRSTAGPCQKAKFYIIGPKTHFKQPESYIFKKEVMTKINEKINKLTPNWNRTDASEHFYVVIYSTKGLDQTA